MRTSLITLALIGGLLIAAAAPSPAWADRRGATWHRNYGGYEQGYYGGYQYVYYGGNGGYSESRHDNGFGSTVPNSMFGGGYGRGYYGRYRNGSYGGNDRDNRNYDYGFGPTISK
jgi:hypothetical protein